MIRAVSGTSGSRVPTIASGTIFGTGTRNIALWDKMKTYFTHKLFFFKAYIDVSVSKSLLNKFSVKFCPLNKNKYYISIQLEFDCKITAYLVE